MTSNKRRRIRRFVALATAAITAAVVISSLAGAAPGISGTFESADGNLAPNGSTDWASPAPDLAVGIDKASGSGDDALGQGTKEDDRTPSVVTGSIPNNKSDLTRFYVGHEFANNNTYLYLAWERVQSPQGTTNMDFELNQASTTFPSSGKFSLNRTAGDLLIRYDLSKGGTTPLLSVNKWITSAAGTLGCEAGNSLPCWEKGTDLSTSANADGGINAGTVTDPIQTDGSINPNNVRSLDPLTFGEAAINLTGAGLIPPGNCKGFATAFVKSRSADSFTAEVKDFIAPVPVNIDTCARVNITKTRGDTGAAQPGAVFTLYFGTGTGGSVAGTCETNAQGQCSFIDLTPGTYTLDETTVPAGFNKDPSLPLTFTLTSNQVMSLPLVDPPKPGRIDIVKDDDANNPVVGAVFTLTQNGVTAGSCTTGADGKCSITDVQPGTYTLDETSVPGGFDKAVGLPTTVTVGPGDVVTLPFEDPRQPYKVIVLVCRTVNGVTSLYPSAVTINNTAEGNSLSTAQAGAANLSETALCNIGTGEQGGLKFNTYPGNVPANVSIARPPATP